MTYMPSPEQPATPTSVHVPDIHPESVRPPVSVNTFSTPLPNAVEIVIVNGPVSNPPPFPVTVNVALCPVGVEKQAGTGEKLSLLTVTFEPAACVNVLENEYITAPSGRASCANQVPLMFSGAGLDPPQAVKSNATLKRKANQLRFMHSPVGRPTPTHLGMADYYNPASMRERGSR